MKLLVPNTSAGMVIGKSGARIKEIRDATGANIQVYPKQGSQEAKVSQERVITIAAESKDVLLNAVERVLEKIAADPLHAHNSELSVSKNQSDEFGSSSTVFHHQQSTGGFGDAYRGAVPPVPSYQQQPPFGPPPSQQAPNNIGYAGGPPQYPPPPTQQQPSLQQNQRPSGRCCVQRIYFRNWLCCLLSHYIALFILQIDLNERLILTIFYHRLVSC
jgi:hypothetical protein